MYQSVKTGFGSTIVSALGAQIIVQAVLTRQLATYVKQASFLAKQKPASNLTNVSHNPLNSYFNNDAKVVIQPVNRVWVATKTVPNVTVHKFYSITHVLLNAHRLTTTRVVFVRQKITKTTSN